MFILDEEVKAEVQKMRFKNKKREKTEDFKEQNNKNKERGIENLKGSRDDYIYQREGIFVASYKDYVFIIQCPNPQKIKPIKKNKLRTAKAIIDSHNIGIFL